MSILRDDVARQMIQEHMKVCEIARIEDRQDRAGAAAAVEKRMDEMAALQARMHEQNQLARERDNKAATARFVSLLMAMLGSLLAPWAVQIFHAGLH